jgi:hypothetical protein
MYLTKETITFVADSTGNDTEYTGVINGALHSISYTPTTSVDTILSTTCPLYLDVETATDHRIWNKTLGSTDVWTYLPRKGLVDSTGVQMGNTTDYPVDKFVLANERIRCQISLSTAAALTGQLDIYIEGTVE